MEPRPAPATSSLSDLFASLPTNPAVEAEPLFPTQELIAGTGDYLLHDQQFVQEQEALQLLNQTNTFSLSSSSSAIAASLPPVPKVDVKSAKGKTSRKRTHSASEEASADDAGALCHSSA